MHCANGIINEWYFHGINGTSIYIGGILMGGIFNNSENWLSAPIELGLLSTEIGSDLWVVCKFNF